jgi:hypothetical protein
MMRAFAFAALCVSVSALAGEYIPRAEWHTLRFYELMQLVRVETVLGDGERKRAIHVNCTEGSVTVHLGDLDIGNDGRAKLEVRFDSDAAARELDVRPVGNEGYLEVDEDRLFLELLEEHDGETLAASSVGSWAGWWRSALGRPRSATAW